MDRISEKFGALQETHYWHSTMRKQISGFLHCLCLVLIKFFHFDSLGCFMSGWGRNHRTVELDGTFKIILLAIVHPCLLSFFLFKVKGGSIYLAHSVYGVQSMIHWLQGRVATMEEGSKSNNGGTLHYMQVTGFRVGILLTTFIQAKSCRTNQWTDLLITHP